MNTTDEIRQMADDELLELLDESRQELFNLRFQAVTGQLDNPQRVSEVKRQVARVLTIQRQRAIKAARDAENA